VHIAWFAEYFCLRHPHRQSGLPPSLLDGADARFDSARVAHASRWTQAYPSRDRCLAYMQDSLQGVIASLSRSAGQDSYFPRLALAHEDMHAEALLMTLRTLGLPLPDVAPARRGLPTGSEHNRDIRFAGGEFQLGAAANQHFAFDNELPQQRLLIAPFSIAPRPVSAAEFAAFLQAPAYSEPACWSAEGWAWRIQNPQVPSADANENDAAMHLNAFQAEAWCRWHGRRLPSEAEWEFAAAQSELFRRSSGEVWEWTSSPFTPYPGFAAGDYREYSQPWFDTHRVLKGGSFATHPRLKYRQYRNFFVPGRTDIFAGFRSCAM
jgi:iron(II)-dependent oxidoreductase